MPEWEVCDVGYDPDELYSLYPWDEEDEDDEDFFDCGYNPSDGTCSLVGTEECDWECPDREFWESQSK